MNPEHEICSELILTSSVLSTEANDLMIKVLEENNDAETACSAITFNSRYKQLNKHQRLKLLKIIFTNELYCNALLQNFNYLNKCKKYEFDYIMENIDINFIYEILKLYPQEYLDSLISKKNNEKFNSIITMIKLS